LNAAEQGIAEEEALKKGMEENPANLWSKALRFTLNRLPDKQPP
jgi:hypothetical protein